MKGSPISVRLRINSLLRSQISTRIQTTLFSYVLTNSERDLYPFALVFSFAEITEAAASSAPNPCSWSSSSGCVGWFFESVVGQILGSDCRIETVVGSLCVSSGCTSYPRCLQQVIGWSSASYPTSWRSGQRPHHSMECEMVEYEFLILDIIVAWRIYFKILATILSVLYA